jgi:hypothetical protein
VVSFDAISHAWMRRFLEQRFADRRVLNLMRKRMKAGVRENGKWTANEVGTPQGDLDFASAGQHLPPLCAESLGSSV